MKSRPDILYLFRGAGHGGDAIAMLRLASAMQTRGLNVRCAASPFEQRFDAFTNRANRMGLQVDAVEYFSEAGASRLKFAMNLRRYLNRLRPRVVHVVTGNGFINPSLAITLALGHRGKRIVTLHGVRSRELTESKHIRDQDVSERFFHAVVTPTEYARQSYLACSAQPRPRRIHVVANLVPPPLDEDMGERHALGLPTGSQVVLFAARLVETKGPLAAIQAFERIAREHPGAYLVIAGDGPELAACQLAAHPLNSRVKFVGYQDDIRPLMAVADVFITPSHFESFGLTTVEAMATGAVVVGFDIPATRELLGGCGRLSPLFDEAALAKNLDWALSNPDARNALAARSQLRYEKNYAPEGIVQKHLNVYGLRLPAEVAR